MFTPTAATRGVRESRAALYTSAFQQPLTDEELRTRVPAAFADAPSARTRNTYTFIPTTRVVNALRDAGFTPMYARQTYVRSDGYRHARHLIRLRRRMETLDLADAVPE